MPAILNSYKSDTHCQFWHYGNTTTHSHHSSSCLYLGSVAAVAQVVAGSGVAAAVAAVAAQHSVDLLLPAAARLTHG